MSNSLEEDLFRMIESLLDAACKSNSYCDLVFVQNRLSKLEEKYYDQRNVLVNKVEHLENLLSKKWSKPDRALVLVSFGTLYPLVRKYQRLDQEQLTYERTEMVNRMTEIEKNYLQRIRRMSKQVEKYFKHKK